MDVQAELDARALLDPRLERYRVPPGGPRALDKVPEGWHLSEAVARLLVDGGWWPGALPELDDEDDGWRVTHRLARAGTHELLEPSDATVRWFPVGSVWPADWFYTPLLREPRPTAPLLGLSSDEWWMSLVFPTEQALLECFVITYDEMGLDVGDEINPCFVEWLTEEPTNESLLQGELVPAFLTSIRLREQAATWSTDHPCWDPEVMPVFSDDQWPQRAVEAAMGARNRS